MTPADREPFLKVVIGFAELKGKQLSAPALELYWNSMQHWPIDDFRAAAQQLVRTCVFMPTPKDFEDLRKAGRPTVAEAWASARAFASTLYHPNGFRNGEIGDYAIDLAVGGIGGYSAIAMCDTGKLHFLEHRFAERFEELRDVEDTRETLPQLASRPDGHRFHRLPDFSVRRINRLTDGENLLPRPPSLDEWAKRIEAAKTEEPA